MKLVWPLLDPATLLGLVLLAAAGLPWLRRRPALERLLAGLPLLLFSLLTMPPLAELAARRLALPESASPAGPGSADVLVVLGGGMDDLGNLSISSYLRTAAALPMWRQGVAPRVLFSGVEARRMAELASKLGLPAEVTTLEPRSLSTWENARRCRELLGAEAGRAPAVPHTERGMTPPARPLPRLALVTTPEHMRRAVRAFHAAGFTVVVPAPAPYPHRPAPPTLAPTFRRAALLTQVLYENLALLAYRLRGWQA